MKTKVSFTAAFLCIIMLSMSVSAASVNDEAYTIYKQAAKKAASISSVEMKYSNNVSMGTSKMSFAVRESYNVKQLRKKDGAIELSMVARDRTEMWQDTYYRDGIAYVNRMDDYKYAMPMDQAEIPWFINDLAWDLSKSQFKEGTIEQLEDGRRIRFKATEEISDTDLAEFDSYFSDSDVTVTIYDTAYSFTISDSGEIKEYTRTLSVSITDESSTMYVKLITKADILSTNTITKIDYPADLNEYERYDRYSSNTRPMGELFSGYDLNQALINEAN